MELVECNYSELGRNVRDFSPFFDYYNVLDVSKINDIYANETTFRRV